MVELDKNQDLAAEAPEFVLLDEQSSALLQRAQDLALNGREDAGAVEELVRMASGKSPITPTRSARGEAVGSAS